MNITRVERDGVEFYTINATGESGMSESGLARLCGVAQQTMNELLQKMATGKTRSECLKPFSEDDFRLQVRLQAKGLNHATVIKAEVCAAVIEHYAFESKRKTKEAQFAFRKFATTGINTWIQGITGWQQPSQQSKLATTQLFPETPPALPPESVVIDFGILETLLNNRLPSTAYRLYLYLLKADLTSLRPNVHTICREAKVSRASFYSSIRCLQNLDLAPDWLIIESYQRPERIVRDRLQQQLGGKTEACTPLGLIDLLTATELIEVKAIDNWKDAIGHVLAKARFYPQHQKRLHLFGKSSRGLSNIQACCAEFEISVTFEQVHELATTT